MNLLAIEVNTLKKSLEIFWKGMVAILVVICVIMLVTYAMQTISQKVEKSKIEKAIKEIEKKEE